MRREALGESLARLESVLTMATLTGAIPSLEASSRYLFPQSFGVSGGKLCLGSTRRATAALGVVSLPDGAALSLQHRDVWSLSSVGRLLLFLGRVFLQDLDLLKRHLLDPLV